MPILTGKIVPNVINHWHWGIPANKTERAKKNDLLKMHIFGMFILVCTITHQLMGSCAFGCAWGSSCKWPRRPHVNGNEPPQPSHIGDFHSFYLTLNI